MLRLTYFSQATSIFLIHSTHDRQPPPTRGDLQKCKRENPEHFGLIWGELSGFFMFSWGDTGVLGSYVVGAVPPLLPMSPPFPSPTPSSFPKFLDLPLARKMNSVKMKVLSEEINSTEITSYVNKIKDENWIIIKHDQKCRIKNSINLINAKNFSANVFSTLWSYIKQNVAEYCRKI